MELVIQILMLFIVINTALKLSFWKWWQSALFGLLCAAFVVVSCRFAVLQSKTQLADYLANSNALQDIAVLITLESTLSIAFCFASLGAFHSGRRKLGLKILGWYPGLLIFPVLFYLLTQTIYATPGSDFTTISYWLAAGVLVAVPLLGRAAKLLYPERGFRLEIHFLVSLFVCIIGLITTVNGNVTYVAVREPVNVRAVALAAMLFLILFLSGLVWNRIKWNFKRKKTNKNTNGNYL